MTSESGSRIAFLSDPPVNNAIPSTSSVALGATLASALGVSDGDELGKMADFGNIDEINAKNATITKHPAACAPFDGCGSDFAHFSQVFAPKALIVEHASHFLPVVRIGVGGAGN
jgi:hypothetical protein